MAFDTQRAITVAANSPGLTSQEQQAIQGLIQGPITESRIKPVIDILIQRWEAEGAIVEPKPPILHPILILESVRLAEARNQLEALISPPQTELDLLPPLTQAILEAGSLIINSNALLKLLRAVAFLKRRSAPAPEIAVARDLLEGLMLDCAGPLGAVYGATVPPPSNP
jgi:hypothetical protein